MSKGRITQHRAKRDTNTRENQELKKEIDSLQRLVARLRKENEKLRLMNDGDEPDAEPIEDVDPKTKCPKCKQSPLSQLVIPGGKLLTICNNCKEYRKVEVVIK